MTPGLCDSRSPSPYSAPSAWSPTAGGWSEPAGTALSSATQEQPAPSYFRAGDVSPAQLIMWKIGRNCMSLSGK